MDPNERCPIYPSMLKTQCSHCQGSARGTPSSPRFSLRESNFHGNPVVEVLRNGDQAVPWDKDFRFGLRKAQMLIACVTELREFWLATDAEKLSFSPRLVENKRMGLRINVFVEMHPDFEHSLHGPIDRPWLQLRALPPDATRIGLGTSKCRIICAVEQDLRNWLLKHGVVY